MHTANDSDTLPAVDALEKLQVALDEATTLAAVKHVFRSAGALADEAAAARDFAYLDRLTTLRLAATRRGGLLLLAGAVRVPGVDEEIWCRRANMDDAAFAACLIRTQTLARRKAGGPAPEGDARCREESPATKTLVSGWSTDEFGNRVRFVVGVSPRRFDREVAAGRDPKEVAAALIAEAIGLASEQGALKP